jgi:hydroxyacylglutathione hydrolase
MEPVIVIPALGDNLIYLYRYDQNTAFVVDPGDAAAVLKAMKKHGLSLGAILITHHHWDHTAGTAELKRKTGCSVIGPGGRRMPEIEDVAEDGRIVTLGNARIQVLATPGHTRTSVCYYVQPAKPTHGGILFTGDTLFVGGCGRLLECGAQTLWESLQRLARLPDDTLVCCGHDYTLENYEFALSVEPNNPLIRQRLDELKRGGPTVPSTISQEKATNPFLRADKPELKAALGMTQAREVEVFAELRSRKDVF